MHTHFDFGVDFDAIFQNLPDPPNRRESVAEQSALALAVRDNGDPQGLYYRLMSELLRRFPKASREQVEAQIELLRHS